MTCSLREEQHSPQRNDVFVILTIPSYSPTQNLLAGKAGLDHPKYISLHVLAAFVRVVYYLNSVVYVAIILKKQTQTTSTSFRREIYKFSENAISTS